MLRELVELQNRGDETLYHFAIKTPDLEKCVAEALQKTWHCPVPHLGNLRSGRGEFCGV